jgi:hypothetical protein
MAQQNASYAEKWCSSQICVHGIVPLSVPDGTNSRHMLQACTTDTSLLHGHLWHEQQTCGHSISGIYLLIIGQ